MDGHLKNHWERQRRQSSHKAMTRLLLFGLLFFLAMRMLGSIAGIF